MAVVRGIAFKVNAGRDRCWSYELAWEDAPGRGLEWLGLDDSVRIVRECARPPTAELLGSGICAEHLAAHMERSQS